VYKYVLSGNNFILQAAIVTETQSRMQVRYNAELNSTSFNGNL
ncbi:uncharacterized protein METZ01_LOCUS403764, partial [marine metagenome]